MICFRKAICVVSIGVACLVLMGYGSAHAGTIVWGNNASSIPGGGGNVTIEAFDASTGAVVQQFLVPNLTARAADGRGIAVLGHTIYYSTSSSGNIYVTNDSTHADLGVLVSTGLQGITNIATDGKLLYVTEYNNTTNVIHKYDLSGNPTGTISLGGPFGTTLGRDGFELTNTSIIANRGDATGPYDRYDLSGNLVQADFIDTASHGISFATGIAFDGTNYYVSDIIGGAGAHSRLAEFDGSGNFVQFIALGGPQPTSPGGRLLEDLAVLGNTAQNSSPVPEPSSLALIGIGLACISGYAWRRRRQERQTTSAETRLPNSAVPRR